MRNYGRFTTSLWRSPEFTSLTQPLQAVYFMLCTQPDVTAAGSLAVTAGRWSKLAADATRSGITEQVEALAAHAGRHLVLDDDTEELLIRKFIKWDGGWANSKRLPVVVDAIKAIASPQIRDIAVDELRKLAASDVASPVQREALCHALSPFDRVVVTEGDYNPQPLNPIPEREPFDASDEPLSMFCKQHPTGTEDSCGPCGTAFRRYKAAAATKLEAEVGAKRAAAEARAACPNCNEHGFRLDPKTRQPAGRCTHEIEAAS